VVKRGDLLGRFTVAAVARVGVVVERSGALYVVPLGRTAAVALAEP
jgi:hypothetical protein